MGRRLVLASSLSTGRKNVTLGALQSAYRRAPCRLAFGLTGGHQEPQHSSSLSDSRAGAALQLPRPAGGSADALKAAAAQRTLSYREAFWLATMGGAQTLGLQVSNSSQALRLLIGPVSFGKTVLDCDAGPAIHWPRGFWL